MCIRDRDIPVDMEVLIHLAPSGPAMFGHADVVYRGLVISYGCYDPHNRHLFGTLGDGVVIIAPKDTYIRNCLENENKTLIGFGAVSYTHLDVYKRQTVSLLKLHADNMIVQAIINSNLIFAFIFLSPVIYT